MNKLKAETNEAKIKSIKKPFKLEKENKAIKDKRINDISNLFRLEKGNKAIELIEYRKLEDVRNLFEHEEKESYCKLYRVLFGVIIILYIKVMVIKTSYYQLKYISIKLNRT